MASYDTTSPQHAAHGGRASTTLLKLQADERLVAHVRRGNQSAFEVLVSRYETRLLAFCRHMLGAGARRDAEDVLQEVFTSAYRAMLGDNRPINVRPWLYRIARNRCLNHLRRDPMPSIEGMEMTVVDERIGTAEIAHQRAEVRQLLADIQALPETQRTAILLREIDDLSYDQIAMAMDNTVAAVKSLLVRARVGLAEAAESRRMSCDDVRVELGEHAEGLVDKLTPATRRHLKDCKQCSAFRQDIKDTTRTLSMLAPAVGVIALIKGITASFGHAGTGAAGGAAAGAATVGGGGLVSIGGVLSAKTMTGLAAAVAVTGAAVEVRQVATPAPPPQVAHQAAAPGSAPGGLSSGGVTAGALPSPTGSAGPAAADAAEPDEAEKPRERLAPTTPAPTTPPAATPATTPAAAPVTTTPPPAAPPVVEQKTDVIDVVPVEEHSATSAVAPPSTPPPATTPPPAKRPPATTPPPRVPPLLPGELVEIPLPSTPPAAELPPQPGQ